MAVDQSVMREFLIQLGYEVDQSTQSKFLGAVEKSTKAVVELGLAVEAGLLAILGFTTQVASKLEDLYWESQRTKTTVENIQAFAFAMGQLGVSAHEGHQALEALSSFLRSSPGAAAMLEGVLGHKLTGDAAQTLTELGERFAQMDTAQALSIGRTIGLSERMVLALRGHGDAIEQYEKQVHDAFSRIGYDADEAARHGVAFMNELREVWATGLQPLIDKIASDMMPELTKDMESFRQLLLDNADSIVANVESALRSLNDMARVINDIVQSITGWRPVLEVIAVYIAGAWALRIISGFRLIATNPYLLAIIAALSLIERMTHPNSAKDWAPDSPFWTGMSREEQLKYPNSPASRERGGIGDVNPNQFNWWNPGSWFGHSAGRGDDRTAQLIMDQLMREGGLTRAQAAGITGNLSVESGFDPTIANASGHIGIAQWDAKRQELFFRTFGYRMGDPRVSRDKQLHDEVSFILQELRTTESVAGQHLAGARDDPSGAAFAINEYYERSGTAYQARMGRAHRYFSLPMTPAPPSQTAGGGSGSGSGKHVTVNNNQNVTNNIHTKDDPHSIGTAVERTSYRANQDLVRQMRSAAV